MSDTPPSDAPHRLQAMTDALRAWDPEAEVTTEPGTGRLMVLTTLPGDKVMALLRDADEHAAPVGLRATGGCGGRVCCGVCAPSARGEA